jgi:hypothetical protein
MPHALSEVRPPSGEIYRVGWHSDPLAPPLWHLAADDGTFGNRFDDPERQFRCIYCGSSPEAAFGETLARFRVSPSRLANIKAAVSDAEDLADIFSEELDFAEPKIPRGIIPRRWREDRRLVTTTLDSTLRFMNFAHQETIEYFRYTLPEIAAECGIDDMDFSTILSKEHRSFTQACARHTYNLSDPDGNPRFHGIRYVSRHNVNDWECWALFDDRVEGKHTPGFPTMIMPDHPALLAVAQAFTLSVEVFPGVPLLRP